MESRRHERFPIQVPVYLSVEGELSRKMVELRTSDVSGGGLSFETRLEIPPGTMTDVVLAGLGDLAADAHITGRVVYALQNPATGRYDVGLQFHHFVNVSRQRLVERIQEMRA